MFCAADGNVGALGGGNDRGQQNGRGKQGDFVAGVAGNERQKCIDKRLGFGGRLVHLPIGGNQFLTGHFWWFLKSILSDGFEAAG